MSLRLKKFDIKNITQDSVILFIGKRCTGKSWLVRDLLYHNRKMPIGTVISGTESANSFYSSIIPSIFIHGEYTEKIISSVLKRQRLALKKMKSDEIGYIQQFWVILGSFFIKKTDEIDSDRSRRLKY